MSGSKNFAGLTPAAQRTVAQCRRLAAAEGQQDSWVAFLVLTLLRDESLASACLSSMGITREWLLTGELGTDVARSAAIDDEVDSTTYTSDACQPTSRTIDAINDPLDFTRVLDRAAEIARRGFNESGVSSASLLLAIVETNDFVRERFAQAGATLERIREQLLPSQPTDHTPLPVDVDLRISVTSDNSERPQSAVTADISGVWRVVDANLNRAREGLRVLEDFARFIASDSISSWELKCLRHELVAAERLLPRGITAMPDDRRTLAHRDTVGDVGTQLSTNSERARGGVQDLIIANCRRVQESLRSLEEFGKLLSIDFGATMKQLRYRSYTVEKHFAAQATSSQATLIQRDVSTEEKLKSLDQHANRAQRLRSAAVYVLITEELCQLPWKQVVEQALAGGSDVLQLREKSMHDRELLRRASWMRDACQSTKALFIVNDRPDIAAASRADGVHVGQDEFPVDDARRVLQPGQLVGVSSHSVIQASQAIADGADYLGVGPVFPSKTKSFDDFPGLAFVRSMAESNAVPWFAIGGVTPSNLDLVIAAGASRVAITSAVAGADNPAEVVRQLKSRLARCGEAEKMNRIGSDCP